MNATVPDLSELAQVIGPIVGVEPHQTKKPLCENIFDVQRSELFDVLELLRTRFWSDEVVEEPIADTNVQHPTEEYAVTAAPLLPTQSSEPFNLKRVREPDDKSEEDDELEKRAVSRKRFRHSEINLATTVNKETHSALHSRQSTLADFAALWPTKRMLIREIKSPAYKDRELRKLLSDIHESHSILQCHHLSTYLIPVAKAMRKQSVVEILKKWICK